MHSLTVTWVGYVSLISFCLAYTLVIFEEQIHMRKSKPVVLIGCFMWGLIGLYEAQHGGGHAHDYVKELIAEIGELFFFLLVAMTYINTMEERNVFKVLRAWLLQKGLGFKKLFWATGLITFLLSPLADNLTSALLMSTVALAVSNGNGKFIVPAFVNFMGMMFGLGHLMMKGYYLKRWGEARHFKKMGVVDRRKKLRFNIFAKVEQVEFDTLLFFFGVLTAVGALQYIGYLALISENMYGTLGPTYSNVIVGVLSAIVDNIPIMYAVLKMDPTMGLDQWLLITLTAGTGGSLLSVGSAAGVAVMGVEKKNYNFMSHLKWAPAISLGYIASIVCWYFVTPH